VMWCGVVWCDVVWCDVVWCGVVWCDVVWCDVMWYAICAVQPVASTRQYLTAGCKLDSPLLTEVVCHCQVTLMSSCKQWRQAAACCGLVDISPLLYQILLNRQVTAKSRDCEWRKANIVSLVPISPLLPQILYHPK
jgi:hypothetical protein